MTTTSEQATSSTTSTNADHLVTESFSPRLARDDSYYSFMSEEEGVERSNNNAFAAIPYDEEEQYNEEGLMDFSDDEEEQEQFFGCKHYKRKCQVEAPCCKTFYTCRQCHDEAVKNNLTACRVASMDRHNVQQIRCLNCFHVQKCGKNLCEHCGITFGRYFCKTCHFYDDSYRDIFHCDGCGICRVGKREDFHHCHTCHCCVPKTDILKGLHKCQESSLHQNCKLCGEFLFTSVKTLTQIPCGHWIHKKCLSDLFASGVNSCPYCSKQIVKLPPAQKYNTIKISVVCNDCGKVSLCPLTIAGLRCNHCGGVDIRKQQTP